MKEIDVDEIMDAILEKQDSFTLRELWEACSEYEKQHPDTYIDKCGDTFEYYVQVYISKYYYDRVNHVVHKQVVYTCPFCDTEHRKFPHVERYNKFLEWSKKVTN